jgi:hypothetical protein
MLACQNSGGDPGLDVSEEACMEAEDETVQFKVIASKAQTGGEGTSTVLEPKEGDELVVVGKLKAAVLENATIQQHLGDDEIAIVIPKSLLLAAAKEL